MAFLGSWAGDHDRRAVCLDQVSVGDFGLSSRNFSYFLREEVPTLKLKFRNLAFEGHNAVIRPFYVTEADVTSETCSHIDRSVVFVSCRNTFAEIRCTRDRGVYKDYTEFLEVPIMEGVNVFWWNSAMRVRATTSRTAHPTGRFMLRPTVYDMWTDMKLNPRGYACDISGGIETEVGPAWKTQKVCLVQPFGQTEEDLVGDVRLRLSLMKECADSWSEFPEATVMTPHGCNPTHFVEFYLDRLFRPVWAQRGEE